MHARTQTGGTSCSPAARLVAPCRWRCPPGSRVQPTGSTVSEQATVVFDTNDPIVTNTWTNTLDGDSPAAQLDALATSTPLGSTLRWSGSDVGSGIHTYDVWRSIDGGPLELWLDDTTATSAAFEGTVGRRYGYAVTAIDEAGNTEGEPTQAEFETVASAAPTGGNGAGGGNDGSSDGGGSDGVGTTPRASASPTASPSGSAAPSASPSGSPKASPTATSTEPGTPATPVPTITTSTDQPDPDCTTPALVELAQDTIIATGSAGVQVRAPAGAAVDLLAYTRPSSTYRVVRSGTVPATGVLAFQALVPPANTRLYAQIQGCTADEVRHSVVLNVRTALSLFAERTGRRTYVFSGDSLPARKGGLIVSLYRVTANGRQVLTAQVRASATDGEWKLTRRFLGAGRFGFVVRTGQDLQNAPGSSNIRPTLMY